MEECEVVPFRYDGHVVEAFRFNGETWFMAKGLGYALGIGNIRATVSRMLPANQVMHVSRCRIHMGGKEYVDPIITEDASEIPLQNGARLLSGNGARLLSGNGARLLSGNGARRTYPLAISEKGMYSIMMRKRGKKSDAFRKWIMSELPDVIDRGGKIVPWSKQPPALSRGVTLELNASSDEASATVRIKFKPGITAERMRLIQDTLLQAIDSLQ